MSRLTFAEQTRLAKLMVDRSCRSASARLKRSSMLKWRYGAPVADKLLIVPQDLRISDPSFASEVEFGHFGLAGTVAMLEGRSVFDVVPPNASWARELHGFGWLRHFYAAGHVAAQDYALALIADWIRVHGRSSNGMIWEPAVAARRMMSWIVNAPLILDGIDQKTYDATTDCLADHFVYLSATWRDAPEGQQRLETLTALLTGALCIAGHDHNLEPLGVALKAELDKQILSDGGHVTRNPGVLIELLLDFLPLRQCFVTRERKLPDGFDDAVKRMLKMVQFMRLGDGRLGRFNGMSAHMIDVLSTVLAYDDRPHQKLASADQSKYLRLERGPLIILMDAGCPPELEFAGLAHAGCLSIEVSSGAHAIFVNGGAPVSANDEWTAAARATASHNTVCLGGKSSSRLVRNERLEALICGVPISGPAGVHCSYREIDGGLEAEAFHDGYFNRFKLLHRRRLEVGASGKRFVGIDRLGPQRGQLRLPQDVPFAIHFHLDAGVECLPGQASGEVILKLGDGQRWRFNAAGAALTIEDSVHYAEITGPRPSLQIVLRGATFGESEVRWSMGQVDE
jgi:uncharacterized heparinase superfamily protein